MKNTIKIVEVKISNTVENNGYDIRLININILDPIPCFKVNEDGEKELKEIRQLTIRLSELKRIFILDDMLALLPEAKIKKEKLNEINEREALEIKYYRHFNALKAAELTIDREEVYDAELDDDGNPIMDEKGEPKKKLISFGKTEYKALKLTAFSKKYIEKVIEKSMEEEDF